MRPWFSHSEVRRNKKSIPSFPTGYFPSAEYTFDLSPYPLMEMWSFRLAIRNPPDDFRSFKDPAVLSEVSNDPCSLVRRNVKVNRLSGSVFFFPTNSSYEPGFKRSDLPLTICPFEAKLRSPLRISDLFKVSSRVGF